MAILRIGVVKRANPRKHKKYQIKQYDIRNIQIDSNLPIQEFSEALLVCGGCSS